MRQRGLKDNDLAFLLEIASQVSPDAYLLTDRDAAREIARRKREIQSLERLKGCKVVVADGVILTCYHSRRKDQRRTVRRGKASC